MTIGLAACASTPPPCATRTEIRRVPQPIIIPVPGRFTAPLPVPALAADLHNRDLEADIRALENLLDRCQADRAEIRRRQKDG